MRRITLGRYGKNFGLADAAAELEVQRELRNSGHDPLDFRKEQARIKATTEARRTTVNALAATFFRLEGAGRYRKGWMKIEGRRIFAKDIAPAIGAWPIEEVTRADCKRIMRRIAERGAPRQANITLMLLRRIFNFGIDEDMLEQNPTTRIKKISDGERRRERFLEEWEITIFLRQLRHLPLIPMTALRMMLFTAQRKGEIVTMEWADIDQSAYVWNLPGRKTKNGRGHTIPLTETVIRDLEELRRIGEDRWVFPGGVHGTHVRADSINQCLSRALADGAFREGTDTVAHFTPHDLRRTARTHMARLGIRREVAEAVLNHVDGSINSVYDRHQYLPEKRRALEALEAKFNGLTDPEQIGGNVARLVAR